MVRKIVERKVGPKGQVVIPKEFREKFGIIPNSSVVMELKEEGILIREQRESVVEFMGKMAQKTGHVGMIDFDKEYGGMLEYRFKKK